MTLLYHAVMTPPGDADEEERRLFVHPDLFRDQIDDLARRGYRTLRLSEFASCLENGRFPGLRFLLSFDDGYSHVPGAVSPILRRHDFSAAIFVPTAHLGGKNTWDPEHRNLAALDLMSADDLRKLDPTTWEVASHGCRHDDLSTMEPTTRLSELTAAREYLSDLLHQPVLDLAYPYGIEDERVRADAQRAGYRMAFTATYSASLHRFRLPRRPVRGDLGLQPFRLMTSSWVASLYRMGNFAPRWAKTTARTILQ